MLIATSLQAQKYELGLSGGTSGAGIIQGVPSQYQGNSGTSNTEVSGIFNYLMDDYWQFGGSIDAEKWTRKGSWPSVVPPASTPVTISVADPVLNICFHANRMVPMYSAINPEMVKSYFYFGASLGLCFTANDGRSNLTSDGKETFDYQNAKGYTIGLQVGYVYYPKRHLGLYAEFAPRYANLSTSDARDAHALESFHLVYWGLTVGLRYRFPFFY
jgi:hypothetical protein